MSDGLGLGLSLASAQLRNGFTISSLFASGEQGAWYDPSDLTSLSQDSAGTVAAAVDSPVGRMMDKSGRGNHVTQATDGFRPILRQDAGLKYYLEFDGADDFLFRTGVTQTLPLDRISALHQISWTASDIIFQGHSADYAVLFQSPTTPQIRQYSGASGALASPAIGANFVATERFDGANSRLSINAGAASTVALPANVPNQISIGARSSGAAASNIRYYGGIMICRALTDAEISATRNYLATKSGVVL